MALSEVVPLPMGDSASLVSHLQRHQLAPCAFVRRSQLNHGPAYASSPLFGAHHGADVPFVLDMLGQPSPLAPADTPENQHVRNGMVEAWIAFARTGHPGWPMYRSEEPTVRCIGGTSELVVEPPAEVDHLWRRFWSQKE